MLNRILLSHSKTPDYNGVISIMCSWSAAHLHSACSGQNRWDRCQLNFCKGVLGDIWTRWPSSVGRSTQTFTFPKQQCFDVKLRVHKGEGSWRSLAVSTKRYCLIVVKVSCHCQTTTSECGGGKRKGRMLFLTKHFWWYSFIYFKNVSCKKIKLYDKI